MPLDDAEIGHIVNIVKSELFNSERTWVSREEFQAYCLRIEKMLYGLYGILGALLLMGIGTILSLVVR